MSTAKIISSNASRIGVWFAIGFWLLVVLEGLSNILAGLGVTYFWVFLPLSFVGLLFGILFPIKYGRHCPGADFWLALVLNATYVIPGVLFTVFAVIAILGGATV